MSRLLFGGGPSVKELQEQIITLSSEKGLLEEQNRELTRKLAQAERNQQSSDRGDGRYTAQLQIEDLQREIDRLNAQLKSSSRQITSQVQTRSSMQHNDLEGKYNELLKNYNYTVHALEGHKAEASRLSQENKTLAKLNEALRGDLGEEDKQANQKKRELEELRREADATKSALSDSKRKIADLAACAMRLQQELSTSEDGNNRLKNEVVLLRDTLVSTHKQISDQQKEIQNLQRENTSIKREGTDLQRKNEALETSCRKHQRDITELTKENSTLKTEVAKLTSTKRMQTDEIAELKKYNEQIQRQASELQRLTANQVLQKSETTSPVKADNLEGIATQIADFSSMYATWERRLMEVDATKDAAQSLLSIRALHEDLVAEYQNFKEHSLQAEQAKVRLRRHEEQYQDQTERLHIFIEKKSLAESEDYSELLVSINDLTGHPHNKIKCFISYAWEPNRSKNAVLQTRLIKIKEDLERSGVEVLLDIHNMEGDINRYMIDGIQASDRVLIICTPRLKQRAEETSQTPNNLQKELQAAVQKQLVDPKFIIPLILEGDRSTSVAKCIENILSLDFTDRKKYCENMVSLSPKGLVPMILGLERHRVYAQLLKGYQSLTGSKK